MPRVAKKKRSRYSNIRKHKYDGHTFDSKREMLRYMELRLAERAGVVADIIVHYPIKIVIGGVPVKYDSGRHMTYVCDFRYYDWEKGRLVYEDVKMTSGFRPEVYKIKKALVRAMGIDILET